MTEPPARPPFRKTAVFDFDGVIHSYDRGWHDGSVYGSIDVRGIRLAHARGFAVAVTTCRDLRQVEAVLFARNFAVALPIREGHPTFWHGGPDGTEVLVTHHKIAAQVYIDDRAVRHLFGDDWRATLDAADRLVAPPQATPEEISRG